MKDNPMQWTQTTPPLSRLDYIATQIYASCVQDPDVYDPAAFAVMKAKLLIEELDKEQTP